MSTASVQFYSDGLGQWTRYNVILPDEGEGPFPVLMQLHGLTDDGDAWLQRSNLVRHAAGLPLIVVLPDGGTSGYLDWKTSGRLHRQRYEQLLMTDVPEHVRRHFNARDGNWAIGGLSMGGYGAMRLALKHPGRFCSVWAHSSAFHIHDMVDTALLETPIEEVNVFRLADGVAGRGDLPVISFDCGTEDDLLDYNRRFHEHLQGLNVEHRYAEHPGAHDWDYWDLHVREALAQHAKVLGLG